MTSYKDYYTIYNKIIERHLSEKQTDIYLLDKDKQNKFINWNYIFTFILLLDKPFNTILTKNNAMKFIIKLDTKTKSLYLYSSFEEILFFFNKTNYLEKTKKQKKPINEKYFDKKSFLLTSKIKKNIDILIRNKQRNEYKKK